MWGFLSYYRIERLNRASLAGAYVDADEIVLSAAEVKEAGREGDAGFEKVKLYDRIVTRRWQDDLKIRDGGGEVESSLGSSLKA